MYYGALNIPSLMFTISYHDKQGYNEHFYATLYLWILVYIIA